MECCILFLCSFHFSLVAAAPGIAGPASCIQLFLLLIQLNWNLSRNKNNKKKSEEKNCNRAKTKTEYQ